MLTLQKQPNTQLQHITNPYIKKVFEVPVNNVKMLSIQEFIQLSKYPIDQFMVDQFLDNLNNDIPIYVNNELIEWCGYTGVVRKQRDAFNRILKKFEKGVDYWTYNNSEYEKYYSNMEITDKFPHPCTFQGKNKTKHILTTTHCFKSILLTLNTSKAQSIRDHFILMENLLIIYWKYQSLVYKTCWETEVNRVKTMDHVIKYTQQQRLKELDMVLREKRRVGVVYYICEKDTPSIVKIGYTYHLPSRLNELQIAHYKELIVKDFYYTQSPENEEQRLHCKYKKNCIRGEWFKIK